MVEPFIVSARSEPQRFLQRVFRRRAAIAHPSRGLSETKPIPAELRPKTGGFRLRLLFPGLAGKQESGSIADNRATTWRCLSKYQFSSSERDFAAASAQRADL